MTAHDLTASQRTALLLIVETPGVNWRRLCTLHADSHPGEHLTRMATDALCRLGLVTEAQPGRYEPWWMHTFTPTNEGRRVAAQEVETDA